jgi:large subunit ribosomal protein L15
MMRAGFEGGQMPIQMRLGKARGPYSKDAMPMGPHRTSTVPVNVRDLERFDAGTEITPELLASTGLIRNTKIDVKVLGTGDLTKKLTVTAHRFSKTAREKIEAAGGTVNELKPPQAKKTKTQAKSDADAKRAEKKAGEPAKQDRS